MANQSNSATDSTAPRVMGLANEISIAERNRIKRVNAIEALKALITEDRKSRGLPSIDFSTMESRKRTARMPVEEDPNVADGGGIGTWQRQEGTRRKSSVKEAHQAALVNELKDELKVKGVATDVDFEIEATKEHSEVLDIDFEDEIWTKFSGDEAN